MAEENEQKKAEQLKNSHRFREQCFLISMMSNLANQNQKTEYKNFTALGGISNSQTINRLLKYKGFDKLNQLTNAQISALVPHIRVYSVEIDKTNKPVQSEYDFQGGFMDLKSILSDPGSRGRNIGIKKFDFDFLGTDPFTADRMISADLTLFGDSLKVFEDPKYEKLLLRSPLPGKDSYTKVVVGWSVPRNNIRNLIDAKLRTAIEGDTLSFNMTLTKHNFSFEQDGSFKLTLSYHGYVDSLLTKINMTGPGSETEAKKDIADEKGLKVGAEIAGEKFSKLSKDIQTSVPFQFDSEGGVEDIYEDPMTKYNIIQMDGSISEVQTAMGGEFPGAEEEIADILSSDPDVAKQKASKLYRTSFIKSRTTERFQRILNSIESLSGENGRIYNLSVVKEELDAYFSTYGGSKTGASPSTPKVKPPAPPRVPTELPGAINIGNYSKNTSLTSVVGSTTSVSGEMNIPFIFLGDLMEAILNVVDYQIKKHRIRIILGTMVYENFETGKREIISMADIPISVSRFSSWFHENFVKKIATKITLSRFLVRLLTELITPAFGQECFGNLGVIAKASNRVSFLNMVGGGEIPLGRIKDMSQIEGKLRGRSSGGDLAETEFNYIVISSNNDPTPDFEGSESADRDIGIIHLRLGQDRGLLKNASFNKMNDANLVADRITKQAGDAFARAWEPYNVDLTLVGNNYFRPGIWFYLLPTLPGRGGTAIASKLGLGGYYLTHGMSSTISPSGFETKVRAIWQTRSEPSGAKKKKSAGMFGPAFEALGKAIK